MLRNIDGLGVVRNLAAGDFGESHGKRLLVVRLGDLDGARKLDGAISLAAHHIVDIVRTLGSERAQQESVIVGGVQQDVDFSVYDANRSIFLVYTLAWRSM